MADKMSKWRGFLLTEVSKRKSWRKGPHELPNTNRIASDLGVNQTTVWRLVYGRRNLRGPSERSRPVPEYRPEQRLIDGLCRFLGYPEEGDLLTAVNSSPPSAPLEPGPPRRKPQPRKRRK